MVFVHGPMEFALWFKNFGDITAILFKTFNSHFSASSLDKNVFRIQHKKSSFPYFLINFLTNLEDVKYVFHKSEGWHPSAVLEP